MAIKMELIAETKGVIAGMGRVEDALENVSDALDDVGRSGGRTADDLERGFKESAKAIKRSTDQIGDGIKGGKLKDVGSEVGGEFAESFGESIRGGDPKQAIVDVVTSLGPALGAAGVAAAALFGLGKALVDDANAAVEVAKRVGGEFYDALQDGLLERAERESILTSALGVDDLVEANKKIVEIAKGLRIPAEVVRDAFLGNEDAIKAVNDVIGETTDSTEGWLGQLKSLAQSDYYSDIEESARTAKSTIDGIAQAQKDAEQAAYDWAKAFGEVAKEAGLAEGAIARARAAQLGGYGSTAGLRFP